MFNKGQLAGLMKQAQAMQDNLKKAQEELAFRFGYGEDFDDMQVPGQTRQH